MNENKGFVTIPSDSSFVEGTKEIASLWGADAIRDCDGTELPQNPHALAKYVYKTYFVSRGDNKWASEHPDDCLRCFLPTEEMTCLKDGDLCFDMQKGYLKDQIVADYENLSYWQVFDRTSGEEIKDFDVDEKNGTLTIHHPVLYHVYNVDFMAKVLWHPVQIYNYLTNHWTSEKEKCYDLAYPECFAYAKKHLKEWCENNPEVDVVRFTTFLYQFLLVFNEKGKEKFVDWFGYGMAASPALLEGFKKEHGYAMKAEDFVRHTTMNTPFLPPNQKTKDYMDYVSKLVSSRAKELVDIVHQAGKKAMMFLGDDWIGSEPYGPYFASIGLDAVVGSVGGGVTVRMLSEIPGVKVHEGRLLPYFFPDTFHPGNEEAAVKELRSNWSRAAGAMMRAPLDRVGFGGYLSLAASFPKFVEEAKKVCDDFRIIKSACSSGKPYCACKVGVLNAWGKIRSWMAHMVAHELWYQSLYSYYGVYECLSGLPVEVEFLNFDDLKRGRLDCDVLLNVGDRGSAWSGGDIWGEEEVQKIVRKFVAEGHGLLGVGEPSALEKGDGHLFRLADVFGVDEEIGFTLSQDKYNIHPVSHFITDGLEGKLDFGEGANNVYALEGGEVLSIKMSPLCHRNVNVGQVQAAANTYGKGRAVYFSGLPYSVDNARCLYRALLWACQKDQDILRAYCPDPEIDVHYYPSSSLYGVMNHSLEEKEVTFYDIHQNQKNVVVPKQGIAWVKGL
ncbi:MAG: 1,3-beta-galactosyl-N-acetylhexosamine phosphorylase [Erysipelotrichaceae bacterium]|nr:1,3-beta-galactosyl-N-acetylhexosamine phosphorylase [Erysipelotrichaceae bacterium]